MLKRIPTVALAVLSLTWVAGSVARADVNPLVLHMLRNLRAVDEIGEGIVLEDQELLERAARTLQSAVREMKQAGRESWGVEASRSREFTDFLDAQAEAAGALLGASARRNWNEAALGLEALLDKACVACHQSFRTGVNRVKPAVLFMTNFLSAWREINRGVLLQDFGLVDERARDLEAIGRVLGWDQVAQAMFSVTDPADRAIFKEHLHRLMVQASRIRRAAADGNTAEIVAASGTLWRGACVSCHDQLRRDD